MPLEKIDWFTKNNRSNIYAMMNPKKPWKNLDYLCAIYIWMEEIIYNYFVLVRFQFEFVNNFFSTNKLLINDVVARDSINQQKHPLVL